MNVRRQAKLAAVAGVIVAGLSAAPAATAITAAPQSKCDPPSGMRVTYSSSGTEKLTARGCVQIAELDNGQAKVTGTVRAAAYHKDGAKWRLAAHNYQLSCKLGSKRALGGRTLKSVNNASSRSVGRTEGSCVDATVSSGTYVFSWSYERKAGTPSRAVDTRGQVKFTVEDGRVADLIIRPMPIVQGK